MKKRSVKLFVLLSVAIMFVFSSVAQGYHTHDTTKQYTLNELWDMIKARNTNYGLAIRNHVWLNEKCIEFFEQRAGMKLNDAARKCIILGAITADFDIIGSSSTESCYNDVGWDVELGDPWSINYLGVQSEKCKNHFYNGSQVNHDNERLTDFATDLNNVSAYEWAYDSDDNNLDFKDALRLTGKDDPKAYRALGEVLHLLADMGSPSHVRNDNHMPGYGEDYYESELAKYLFFELDKFDGFKYPTQMMFAGTNLKIAFDQLQSYTERYFFSNGTLFETKQAGVDLDEVEISDYDYPEGNYYYILNADGKKVARYSNEYLIDYNYTFLSTYEDAQKILEENDRYLTLEGTHEDLWIAVAPKVIAYGAGIINEFVKQAYLTHCFYSDDSNGWEPGNKTEECDYSDERGSWSWPVRVIGENPGVKSQVFPFFMRAENTTLYISVKVIGNKSLVFGTIYLRDETGNWDNPVYFDTIATDGEYHTYRIDLSQARSDLKFNQFSVELSDGLSDEDEYWLFDFYEISNSVTLEVHPSESIQSAINIANDGDEIIVYPGTYPENINLKGKSITIRSKYGPETTIIDGSQNGSVVTFTEGDNSTLDGFTITNGSGTNSNSIFRARAYFAMSLPGFISENLGNNGGGIYCSNSSPSIINCTISKNSVYSGDEYTITPPGGGGIFCYSSSPSITNCTISENSVYGGSGNSASGGGGGIFCYSYYGDSSPDSSPSITNCTISGNSVYGYSGSGIRCSFKSLASISNCTITGNSTSYGDDGIYCHASGPSITNCTISRHSTGIVCYGSGPSITNCTITGNSTGIVCTYSSSSITNCIIMENSTGIGSSGSSLNITNCTISENSDGISFYSYSDYPSATNTTNCIFWNNSTNEIYVQDHTLGDTFTITYSDIKGGWGTQEEMDLNHNIDVNPMFVGGGDYHLTAESHCIDKATNDTGTYPAIPSNDIDGDARPQGAGYDMGADEFAYHKTIATPIGENVEIFLLNSSITFENVTDGGVTTITTSTSSVEAPPSTNDFQLLGEYYNITTTAIHSGTTTVCLTYDDNGLTETQEQNLQLLHYNVGHWENITITALDVDNNTICGQTDSLSPFIVALPVPASPPPVTVPLSSSPVAIFLLVAGMIGVIASQRRVLCRG